MNAHTERLLSRITESLSQYRSGELSLLKLSEDVEAVASAIDEPAASCLRVEFEKFCYMVEMIEYATSDRDVPLRTDEAIAYLSRLLLPGGTGS